MKSYTHSRIFLLCGAGGGRWEGCVRPKEADCRPLSSKRYQVIVMFELSILRLNMQNYMSVTSL